MIDARELRIGNWVLLGKDQVKLDLQTFKDWDYYEFHPIPLASEVLERCGMHRTTIENPFFSMYNFESGNKREVSVHNPGTPDEMVLLSEYRGENKHDIIVVRHFDYDGKTYLHQLQNIIHALTGTELDYKP